MGPDKGNVLKQSISKRVMRNRRDYYLHTPYERLQNSACPLHNCCAEAFKNTIVDAQAMTNDHSIIVELVNTKGSIGMSFCIKRSTGYRSLYVSVPPLFYGGPINGLEIANFVVLNWLCRRS